MELVKCSASMTLAAMPLPSRDLKYDRDHLEENDFDLRRDELVPKAGNRRSPEHVTMFGGLREAPKRHE